MRRRRFVFALAFVEERVHALCVGVPYVDDGASNRLAVHVAYDPVHEQHLAFVGAVIETGIGFRQRCVRDVERAFDGPRSTLFDAGRLVLGVHAQIEKMFKTETRC
jgi:hypothetical protein